MKQTIIPIVAVAVGIAAFALSYQYLQGEKRKLQEKEKALYEGARKTAIVAAAHDIPGGTVIKPSDVGKKSIYATSASDRMITPEQANLILGKKTLLSIKGDNPILWSDIEGGAAATLGLAPIIKPGMRAISLSIGGAAAVSCMVQPNDRVDVLGTFSFPSKTIAGEMETVTLTVLQDVTVLAAGQQLAKHRVYGRRSRRSTTYSTLTLEVTPRESELLVFAEQLKGRLTLSLRNPKDMSFESDLPQIDFRHLEEKLPELNLYRQQEIRHKRNLSPQNTRTR